MEIPTELVASIDVTMFPLSMVFTSNLQNTIIWCEGEGIEEGSRPVFGEGWYMPNEFAELRSMTSYVIDVFVADRYGSVLSTMCDAAHGDVQLQRSVRTLEMHPTIAGPVSGCQFPKNRFYLVESDGELFFVVS